MINITQAEWAAIFGVAAFTFCRWGSRDTMSNVWWKYTSFNSERIKDGHSFWWVWPFVKLLLAMSLLTTIFVPWQFTQGGNYPRFANVIPAMIGVTIALINSWDWAAAAVEPLVSYEASGSTAAKEDYYWFANPRRAFIVTQAVLVVISDLIAWILIVIAHNQSNGYYVVVVFTSVVFLITAVLTVWSGIRIFKAKDDPKLGYTAPDTAGMPKRR